MKKQLLMAAAAVAAVCGSAMAQVDYTTGQEDFTNSREDRVITGLTVTDDAGGKLEISGLQTGSSNPIYFDKTADCVFTTSAGATVTVTPAGKGIWMQGYLYVDWGKDGFIYNDASDYVEEDEHYAIKPGSDLVAFTGFAGGKDATFYNSKGDRLSNGNREYIEPMSFTVPADAAPGIYRVRFKIDWNNVDPCGIVGDANVENSLARNGGVIVDFALKVAYVPVDVTNYSLAANNGWVASASSITEDNSSATGPYAPGRAIDDNTSSYWASSWSGASHPHTFCLDLIEPTNVAGFEYQPRMDRSESNGVDRLHGYKVYLTNEPVEGYDFTDVEPIYEGTLENTQALQRVEFGKRYLGRYFYLQSASAINANGSESVCFSMSELHLLNGFTDEEFEDAKIQALIDKSIALAYKYGENNPLLAEDMNAYAETIKTRYTVSNVKMMSEMFDMTPEEYVQSFIIESIANTVKLTILNYIDDHHTLTFYQPLQGAFLTSDKVETDKGWDSFGYWTVPTAEAGWRLVSCVDNNSDIPSFYLKSSAGTYVATPVVGYAKVVEAKEEATPFTISCADGYVYLICASDDANLAGTALGFAGNNTPLALCYLWDGINPICWGVGLYEAKPTTPEYYVFESKRNSGKYLVDNEDELLTSQDKQTGFYCSDKVTPNMLWEVTEGYEEGTVWVKNYVTGRYMVDFQYGCDVTLDKPIDIKILDNNGDGVMIHGVAAATNLDANNYNDCVGFWAYGGDGSVWYQYLIDLTSADSAQDALDFFFNVTKNMENAVKAVEAYRNTLPGSAELVDKAVADLNAIDSAEGAKEKVDAIVASVPAGLRTILNKLAEEATPVVISNTRRAARNQAPYLASVLNADSELTFNTVREINNSALWTVGFGDTEDDYTLFNLATSMFVGSDGAKPTDTEVQTFSVNFRDNGTINFTQTNGSNLLNIDTNGSPLTYWYDVNDQGSQWVLSALPQFEADAENFVEWNDVVEGVAYQPISSCSFTVTDGVSGEWTGLGRAVVFSFDQQTMDLQPLAVTVDTEAIAFDAETKTMNIPLTAPLVDFLSYMIVFSENAFAITTEDGSVKYSPEMSSDWALVYYAPDKVAPLSVTPAAGEVKNIATVVFDVPGAAWYDVSETEDLLVVTKDDEEILSLTSDDVYYNYYNEETGLYEIALNQTEVGTYKMVVPEAFFLSNLGYNEEVTIVWTIIDTGITDVTINGEAAEKIYDLQGRRLNRAIRGINIINGRKALVK